MRTVMTISIIVALLLGGSYISYRFIENTTGVIGDQLETVQQSLSKQDWELAKSELLTVQESWGKNNLWWSILIDHQEIDAIDLSLKRLEKFIETENLSHSKGEVATLILRFRSIHQSEKLSLENIF